MITDPTNDHVKIYQGQVQTFLTSQLCFWGPKNLNIKKKTSPNTVYLIAILPI